MAKKKTTADFKIDFYKIFDEDKIQVIGEYTGNNKDIALRCGECYHTMQKQPKGLLARKNTACDSCRTQYGVFKKHKSITDISELEIDSMVADYINGLSTVKIGEKYGYNPKSVGNTLKRAGVNMRDNKENSRQYHIGNEDYFENIDTPAKAYILGFYYADGYLSPPRKIGIAIHQKDKALLEFIKKELDTNYKINDYESNTAYGKTKYSRLLMFSDKMYADVQRHGFVEQKTNVLTFPELRGDLIRFFILGYFDGDGSFSKSGSDAGFTISFLGTSEFLSGVLNYLFERGLYKHPDEVLLSKRQDEHVVTSFSIGGVNNVNRIMSHFYQDAPFCLKRKYNRFLYVKGYAEHEGNKDDYTIANKERYDKL